MSDEVLKYSFPRIHILLTLSSDEESSEVSLAWEETLSSTALQFVEVSEEDESHSSFQQNKGITYGAVC